MRIPKVTTSNPALNLMRHWVFHPSHQSQFVTDSPVVDKYGEVDIYQTACDNGRVVLHASPGMLFIDLDNTTQEEAIEYLEGLPAALSHLESLLSDVQAIFMHPSKSGTGYHVVVVYGGPGTAPLLPQERHLIQLGLGSDWVREIACIKEYGSGSCGNLLFVTPNFMQYVTECSLNFEKASWPFRGSLDNHAAWRRTMTMTLAILVVAVLGAMWIKAPSPFARAETPYVKCLDTVLQKGNLSDAETMCKHLR